MEATPPRLDSEYILGIPVSPLTKDACLEMIMRWLHKGGLGHTIICANPHSMEMARQDRLFWEALITGDLIVPDGIGVVLASRVLGGQIRERVTGTDIFLGLNRMLNREGGRRVFFLGSKEETLAKIQRRFVVNFPNVQVAGTYSPSFCAEFTEEENGAMVEAVNEAKSDVLWVGMTAPKQEKWIYQNRDKLRVTIIGAIGAAFDFYAGTKKRSSVFWQKLGLEWLPRFLREPQRLRERNLKSSPVFLYRIFREWLGK